MKATKIHGFVLACVAAALSNAAPAPRGSQETVELKVIKSYLGREENARFRSYLVEWKGQEVIVLDPRATTTLRSDDVLSVLVISNWNSALSGPLGILTFLVSPKYRGSIPPIVDAQNSTSKSVQMKITRVLFAKDGELVFKAYLGDWNGQEVAINDRFGTTEFAVGDTVSVTVTRIPFESQGERHEALTFSVVVLPDRRRSAK